MANKQIKQLVLTALFCALIAVCTIAVAIPIPATQGYVNVGDCMVFLAALLFGPGMGAIAGGIGSALADIFLGYAHWAPFTLVIKGAEGALVGLIAQQAYRKGGKLPLRVALGVLAGAAVMVTGYFLAGWLMFGLGASFGDLIPNLIQGLVNAVCGFALWRLLFGASDRIRKMLTDDSDLTD